LGDKQGIRHVRKETLQLRHPPAGFIAGLLTPLQFKPQRVNGLGGSFGLFRTGLHGRSSTALGQTGNPNYFPLKIPFHKPKSSVQSYSDSLGACLKIESGPVAVGFGGGQGGEARVSPQRAVKAEPTPANAKRRAEGPLSILRQALKRRHSQLSFISPRPAPWTSQETIHSLHQFLHFPHFGRRTFPPTLTPLCPFSQGHFQKSSIQIGFSFPRCFKVATWICSFPRFRPCLPKLSANVDSRFPLSPPPLPPHCRHPLQPHPVRIRRQVEPLPVRQRLR